MLNRSRQLRIIVDWFNGVPVDLKALRKDDYLPTVWWIIGELRERRRPKKFNDTAKKLWGWLSNELRCYRGEEGLLISQQLAALLYQDPRYPNLAELAETLAPVTWLWEKWLPIGMLSVLAARPGAGKSLVALDLIRKITAGEDWPDATPQPAAGTPCIYVDAENIPIVLNERAQQWEAWGMKRELIYPVLPPPDCDVVNLADPDMQDKLFTMTLRLRPSLVVVDSLRDVLPNGESAVEDVRATLAYLSNLASENDTAVLLIHHLRKVSNSAQLALIENVNLDDLSGSGYIGGRARTVLGLTKVQTGPQPNKNGPRKIEVVKSNLAECPDDLGIAFTKLPPEGLRLEWSQNAPKRYNEPTERDEASSWLITYLTENGPTAPKAIIEAARESGIARATVYRARETLQGQIINSKGRRSPDNCWTLVGDQAEDDAPLLAAEA